MLLLMALIASFFSAAFTYDCGIPPLVLSNSNETLIYGVAINRGISMQFFPSGQKVSLRPTFVWNNTRIRNNIDCKGNSSEIAACQGASGSTFIYNSDFHPEIISNWKKRLLTIDSPPSGVFDQGYAQSQFNNGPEMELPLEIWSTSALTLDFTNKSMIALGPKSSVLWNLLESGKIPSNTTGYDHGSRSFSNYSNGEIVIGGFNKARIAGPFVNYTIAEFQMPVRCSLVVKVKAFTLNNLRGSFPIIEPGTTVLACIDPLQNAFTLPTDLFQRWTDITERPPPPNMLDYQTFPKEMAPLLGTLSIELEGGYKTTVPHHELVNPDRRAVLTENGQYGVVSNSSRIQSAVSSGQSDYGQDFGILLGGVFLSSTYLLIDWDHGVFGLAPSIPHAEVGASDIQKVCSIDKSVPRSTNDTSEPPQHTPKTKGGESGLSSSDKITLGTALGIGFPALIVAMVGVFLACRHSTLITRALGRKERHHAEQGVSVTAATPWRLSIGSLDMGLMDVSTFQRQGMT